MCGCAPDGLRRGSSTAFAPDREGAILLQGSCGAKREGHPPSLRIRRSAPKSPELPPPSARKKGGLRPLNRGGTTKRTLSSLDQGGECFSFAARAAGNIRTQRVRRRMFNVSRWRERFCKFATSLAPQAYFFCCSRKSMQKEELRNDYMAR